MKKAVVLLLAAGLIGGALSGCGENGVTGTGGDVKLDGYPIDTDVKLTWWTPLNANVSASYKSLNETPFAEGLIERTGVNIEFVHPPQGQELERFNLMIASDAMCDIVEYNWLTRYSGGPVQAISDNVILSLNDLIDKYSPNYKAVLEDLGQTVNQYKTDSGDFYMYAFMQGDRRLKTYFGLMARKDLMEQVGYTSAPETIAELEDMLYKFKDIGIKTPISLNSSSMIFEISALSGAFGMNNRYYVEDGVVKYGAYQPEYQEYVKMLAKWFKDGILDNEWLDGDTKRLSAMVTNGEVGVISGTAGANMGLWQPILQQNIPGASLVAIPYPSAAKGEKPKFGQVTAECSNGAAIAASSANPEIAAKTLDYAYSDEGHLYYNFGSEGESYNMVDGVPTYTDLVIDESKNGGVSVGQGIAKYARASYDGAFVQDYNYITQYYQTQEQKDALEIWSNTDAAKYAYPSISMSADEQTEFTEIMSNINTYVDESLVKFINGQLSADDMGEYYSNLKKMNIERAIELKQNAYDRYMK